MSEQAINWVFEHSKSRLEDRLVFLALAHMATGDGHYESITLYSIIAGMCGLPGERSVARSIRNLIDLEEIEVGSATVDGELVHFTIPRLAAHHD